MTWQGGEKRMQKMIWTGIGVSAAVVIGTVSLFGTGGLHFNNVIKTPAQLEQTASENNQTTQSSEVLTEQSVYYARKLGKKASDTEYFKNRMISDDLMEYIQKAVPLADAVPTELMKINLDSFTVEEMGDDLKSIALTDTTEISDMIARSLATMMVGTSSDTKALAAYALLEDNQYLNMELNATVGLWLYYGEDLPSVLCVFIPREGGTELTAGALDAASYETVRKKVAESSDQNSDNSDDVLIEVLAQRSKIDSDLSSLAYSYLDQMTDDSSQTEGLLAAATLDEPADATFFNQLVDEIIGEMVSGTTPIDELTQLFTVSSEVADCVKKAQTCMEEVAKGSTKGTLTAYQVPSSSYWSAEQIASGVSNGSSMNQIAASSVLSRIVHERTPLHAITTDWKDDVVLAYTLSDLALLISVEEADNCYLKINTNFVWLDEKNNGNIVDRMVKQYGLEQMDLQQ